MPPEVLAALISLSVLVLGLLGGYLGGWFKRQTDKANAAAEKAKAAAALENQAAQIKSDIEAQNLKERETIRGMVDFYVERVKTLTLELETLRANFRVDMDALRLEILTARSEITVLTERTHTQDGEIIGLRREIAAGREREAKLREDVDSMPAEIARLEALLLKKGNGDGQGTSESLLSAASEARVAEASQHQLPPADPVETAAQKPVESASVPPESDVKP